MITKQQALEFLYKLSKLHVVHLDIPCGYAYIDRKEDEYNYCGHFTYTEELKSEQVRE